MLCLYRGIDQILLQSFFRVGIDNKDGFAGWLLDNVEIDDPLTETRLYFPCKRWIDMNEEDKLIEEELSPYDKGMYLSFYFVCSET